MEIFTIFYSYVFTCALYCIIHRYTTVNRDGAVEGLARGEARERRESPRHEREARDAERETCTLRCTRERTRETRGSKEREPRTRARERERERAHARECDVAGCASYIEALE